jgi:hypothetical protein
VRPILQQSVLLGVHLRNSLAILIALLIAIAFLVCKLLQAFDMSVFLSHSP